MEMLTSQIIGGVSLGLAVWLIGRTQGFLWDWFRGLFYINYRA